MAIARLGFPYRAQLPLRCPSQICCSRPRKVRRSSVAAVEIVAEPDRFVKGKGGLELSSSNGREDNVEKKAIKWKKLSSKELGISTSNIGKPIKVVLNNLRMKGFEVYLVGGCVRDLILDKIPKDYDVITSAELHQVRRAFSRCLIVGRRFPICHVYVDNTIVEVSSFSTSTRKSRTESKYMRRPPGCNASDYLRWRNCLQRDFTINGLMFDPYEDVIYDYVGGIEDIMNAKVRTVNPADTSFQEDCARILRGVRIAARLGFRFSKETACSVKDLASTVLRLDKGRLLMELNYMLAYGSAEASLRLLWKIGLLEILLPIQAAYFVSQGFRRRDKGSNMLLSLFSKLDSLLAPNRPCHSCLWIALLALHKALVDHPKDPMVVAVFCLAVHNGGDLVEAVNLGRRNSQPHDQSLCELLEPKELDDEKLVYEVLELATSMKIALNMMTDESCVSQAMMDYPQAPFSDLVFIPLALFVKVCGIVDCVRRGKEKGFTAKRGKKIDYEDLASGDLKEVRHTFARVVFDTIYPPNIKR